MTLRLSSHLRAVAILPFALSLLLFSCAPRHPKDMREIERLRSKAEDLVKAQGLMGFESWAYGKPSNQDSLYKANAGLFTMENIALVKRAESEEPDSVQRKRLRYFLRYLSTEYIAQKTAALNDSAANIEAAATLTVGREKIPFRQLMGLLSNEPRQERRAELYAAATPVVGRLDSIFAQVEDTNRAVALSLGYPSYDVMTARLKDFDGERLRTIAEQTLATTDSLYTFLLADMLKRYLHLTPARFFRYDVGALFRNRTFDAYFPPSSMLRDVEEAYKGMGIDIRAERNLTIDDAIRPEKNPRAVCFAIDIPNDIRLSIKPSGGFSDYAALFHEMGHAQHYAHTTENSFEFKYAGAPAVTESYAFLSEYLLSNPAWLRQRTSMPVAVLKRFLRFQVFYRLYMVRRYAAKYLFELQLHDGAADAPALYARTLSSALGYRSLPDDERWYLVDLDPLLYSAGYLRAWFLESEINARLSKEFGVNWFESPKAGDFLRSLWAYGDRLEGKEVSQRMGYDFITPDPWLAEIKSLMLYSTR